MKVAAIIAEYNPFHNGHKYLIDKCRDVLGVDYVVIIMSGNYTQRGIPAICDKYRRAKMALVNGADLVLELSTIYATASAEFFAYAGCYIADKLGFIDYLVFGSECGDIDALIDIAKVLKNEPADFKENLQSQIKQGFSFPAARAKAIEMLLGSSYSQMLSNSNNTLGIEYIKALLQLNSTITPITFSRIGAGHNDDIIKSEYSSSSAIREGLLNSNLSDLNTNMPIEVIDILKSCDALIYRDDLSQVMHYALLTADDYNSYFDIDSNLSKRILKLSKDYSNYSSFIELIKTKNYTHSHISRALLHILLRINFDIKKEPGYTTILGFNKSSKELLSHLVDDNNFKIIAKNANYKSVLSDDNASLKAFEVDILAHDIYEGALISKSEHIAKSLFTCSPVII